MSDEALKKARAALASRDFQLAVRLTNEVLAADPANESARLMAEEAQSKIEASPFVEQFAKKCEQQVAAGNTDGARTTLERARALDADHPAIPRMQQLISSGGAPAGFNFDSGPSFVVDNPSGSPPGRSTAQATDFGFTFEEAAAPAAPASSGFSFDSGESIGGGFSFDETPSAPAAGDGFSFDPPGSPAGFASLEKQPASGEFDFSGAAMQTSPEDQAKVDQFLAEGDRAFSEGDYQKAIDVWSRIFLIDVTNDQASERIEQAKAKRKEAEQQSEATLAAAIQAFERKDFDSARVKFAEVLQEDPNNATAQDYMDRLTESVAEGGAPAVEMPYNPPSQSSKYDDMFDEDELGVAGSAAVRPPEPKAAPAGKKGAAKKTPAKTAAKKPLPMGLLLGVVGVIVLLGGGWYVWSTFLSKPDYDPAATEAILKRAGDLAQQGKYEMALAALQEIQPDDPQHDKALMMIADLQQKKSTATQSFNGKPAAVYYKEQLDLAQTALGTHDYVGAKTAFEQAMRVKPLPPSEKAQYQAALQQVQKLDAAKHLFAERKYQEALLNLESLAQQDPSNRNIQRLIIDAHFNLGAIALQEERLTDAVREFDEVLKHGDDELARRSRELALRYEKQTRDLLYKIYVKYLPLRQGV